MNTGEIQTRIEPWMEGIDTIENIRTNSSCLSKVSLKKEVQTMIGEGNGTISIGEGTQSTLSLTSLKLPSGNYLLFAGAYEKEKGLVGLARKELSISPARSDFF